MAIDTAQRRLSTLTYGQVFMVGLVPDGTIADGDRQTVALSYEGILADEAAAVEALVGGVKARKIKYEEVAPLWKQKEKEQDWVDTEIAKESKKLRQHRPDIVDISATVDEQIREIYRVQTVKRKKRNRKKAMAMLLESL